MTRFIKTKCVISTGKARGRYGMSLEMMHGLKIEVGGSARQLSSRRDAGSRGSVSNVFKSSDVHTVLIRPKANEELSVW